MSHVPQWIFFPEAINLDFRRQSVQFSRSVMSLQPYEPQHARPLCPSPTPEACSKSCPSSWWCHPAISILGHPILLLPSILPRIRVFSNESVLLIRWPKYSSFSFSISPSNEYSRLISFRMDWLEWRWSEININVTDSQVFLEKFKFIKENTGQYLLCFQQTSSYSLSYRLYYSILQKARACLQK